MPDTYEKLQRIKELQDAYTKADAEFRNKLKSKTASAADIKAFTEYTNKTHGEMKELWDEVQALVSGWQPM
jgi:hypothetical protein